MMNHPMADSKDEPMSPQAQTNHPSSPPARNPIAFGPATRPPVFASVEAQRAHVKRTLAAAFRVFARHGLNLGVAGHLTARDPGRPDHFWVNPFGKSFARMTADDLSLVRHDGQLVQGAAVNAAAFAIHAEVHRLRPDVVCAAHGHPVHGSAWSTRGRLLEPLNQDVCAFFEDHVLFGEATGLVTEMSEGERIARTLGLHKAAILRNHGLLTVGRSVDEALWWFVLMERCCRIQLLAEGSERLRLPDEQARQIASQIGTPAFGWFQCQPLLEEDDDWRAALDGAAVSVGP